jgi:hypothetical protein
MLAARGNSDDVEEEEAGEEDPPPLNTFKVLVDTGGTTGKYKETIQRIRDNKFDRIYAFGDGNNTFHEALGRADAKLVHKQRVAADSLRENVVGIINLDDPTRLCVWQQDELEIFKVHAMAASGYLKEGEKVLFLCVGGENRSKALAWAAVRLAYGPDAAACHHNNGGLVNIPTDFDTLVQTIGNADFSNPPACCPVGGSKRPLSTR